MRELLPAPTYPAIAAGPEKQTAPSILVRPLIWCPETMVPGLQHLVKIDLEWMSTDGIDPHEWPFEAEEYAYVCTLGDPWGIIGVRAVQDTSIVIHRFGGSYGEARFIAEVDPHHPALTKTFSHPLQLGIFNPMGVPVTGEDIDVRISVPDRTDVGRPLRIIPGDVILGDE